MHRALAHVFAGFKMLGPSRPVLYIAGAGGLGLWYQAGLLHLAKLLRRKRYFHHHSYAYLSRRSSAMSWIMRAEPVHVALSGDMAAALGAMYPHRSRVLVQSNAAFIDPPPWSSDVDHGGELRLVHVSNLSFAKGLGSVLDAYHRLSSAGHRCTLTLVGPCTGPGELRAIEGWAGPPVRYLGELSPPDVQAVLLQQDVFLFPR